MVPKNSKKRPIDSEWQGRSRAGVEVASRLGPTFLPGNVLYPIPAIVLQSR